MLLNKPLILLILIVIPLCSFGKTNIKSDQYVRVENGEFYIKDKSYRYIGTNFWYGPILASQGRGGDRVRLAKELDKMQEIGINNLRILVGGDGKEGLASHIEPTLQIKPGVYNDTILEGLDYLLLELEKRHMKAVLYLNNAWEWSGGFSTYLEWAGEGKAPIPSVDGWPAYMEYVKKFAMCDSAKEMSYNHVRNIVSRINSINGKPYKDSPAIMSWQIANEPRAFSEDNKDAFAQWIHETAKIIKLIDSNHLVSTGSEGKHGCEEDIELWDKIHSFTEIDYANIHIWPYNWSWITPETTVSGIDVACENTHKYISRHYSLSKQKGKPLVLEEFGYPRDNMQYDMNTPTIGRDMYYKYVFSIINDSGMIAGCNFWGWGGFAVPKHKIWQSGDDYTGDPAQEEQGLNSVFLTDASTIGIIKKMTNLIIYNKK